jgi:Flp pilus assembly protein TadD
MFKYALELKPDSPEALSSLGVIYLRVGETENAEKLLKAATDLEPHNAENWYNFACLHVTKGDTALAGDSLSRALTLDRQATYALAAKDSRMASLLSSLSEVPATK